MNTQNDEKRKEFDALSPLEKSQVLFQQAVKHHREDKLDEALPFYSQAIAFNPDFADAYNNMAVALRKQSRYDAALACYQKSLSIRDDHAGTYSNMGNVLNDMDRITESVAAHYKAIEHEPDNLLYIYNTALVLRDAGKYDDAITLFNQVLAKDPAYKDCRWDRSLTYLMAGRLKEGFAEYDARWELEKSPPRKFNQPRWQADPLEGRTLYIHREQGFGDAIQFIRLIPELKKRFGGSIILECQPELIRLFEGYDGIDQIVPFGQKPPAFDVWIPLMSLAHILDVDIDHIPGEVPLLKPPADGRFRVRPAPQGGANIGLVWGGSPTHKNDRRRSVELKHFLPLAGYKGVTVFSLQKGERAKELETTGAHCLFVDAAKELKDFADTASLIHSLDLIITIDTSVAHLAGALGKECWLMLPFTPDWRWMNEREDSPWYPHMRIFRQKKPTDWEGTFKRLYHALDEKLAR
ncbi:TPR repeat-containing protein [Candidatus Terasakiella magnetica]|uniref:TPR repeat-containing protein n=1 Tax=Candidatus Terasakiella magnetica TaxID=1867952 RepID=A0A1C3RFC7_9PROT|nr:tetratricopeptide repeat-containing glycosyltransferase family protein [Candidatus Terasakiella magnetica]SCA55987.1 TPR repeat-containing protein [Candidatus Terasakiella magnetica]